MEDEVEVAFVEMETVGKCAKEHLKMTKEIDKMKIGLYQPLWKEGNDTRQEPQGIPPAPSASRFTYWSSLGSPHARTSPHGTPNREIEQGASQPDQWTSQSGSVQNREEVARDCSKRRLSFPIEFVNSQRNKMLK